MKLLPVALLVGGGLYLAAKGFNTTQAVKRLEYRNPRLKFKKINLSGVELVITLDITNPTSANIPLQYFAGNVNYNNTKLSSFTFDATKTKIDIAARSTVAVPFTLIISSYGAIQTLVNIYKNISSNTKLNTMLAIDATMYAAGVDVPVKFNYDFKNNAVSGIGATTTINRTWFKNQLRKGNFLYEITGDYSEYNLDAGQTGESRGLRAAPKDLFDDWYLSKIHIYGDKNGVIHVSFASSTYYNFILKPNAVSGIGKVAARLEFRTNTEMENYFANPINRKMYLSKN